jgi:hypothetical protein
MLDRLLSPLQRGFFLTLLFFALTPSPVFTQESAATQGAPETQNSSSTDNPETQPSSEHFTFGGELRQETAYRLSHPHNFTKIKEVVKLNFKTKYDEHFKLKFGVRGWYDAIYDLSHQYPPDVNDNMKKELSVRDAYLDITYPKWNIRLGSQQIVWGEALGRFFADLVTPKDFREFVLQSFEDIRIPIWALDVQYNFIPDATLELVASPDLRVDKIPLPGSEFAFFIPPPPPGARQVILPDSRPPSNFERWNGGTRVSYLTSGWDLAWFFYTSYSHVPILFKTLSTDPSTGQTTLFLNPRHPRVYELGSTFTKSIKGAVLKGEFVYTPNNPFNAQDITLNQGVTKGHSFRYVLGVDYPIGGKVDMNLEFQQEAILATSMPTSDQRLSSWLLFHFSTGFFDEKLQPELTFIVGLGHQDIRISPSLQYNVTRSVALSWGVDLFYGSIDQLYGEFRDHNRAYMNTQFKF